MERSNPSWGVKDQTVNMQVSTLHRECQDGRARCNCCHLAASGSRQHKVSAKSCLWDRKLLRATTPQAAQEHWHNTPHTRAHITARTVTATQPREAPICGQRSHILQENNAENDSHRELGRSRSSHTTRRAANTQCGMHACAEASGILLQPPPHNSPQRSGTERHNTHTQPHPHPPHTHTCCRIRRQESTKGSHGAHTSLLPRPRQLPAKDWPLDCRALQHTNKSSITADQATTFRSLR